MNVENREEKFHFYKNKNRINKAKCFQNFRWIDFSQFSRTYFRVVN